MSIRIHIFLGRCFILKNILSALRFFRIMRNYDVVHIVDQSYGYLALVNPILGKDNRSHGT